MALTPIHVVRALASLRATPSVTCAAGRSRAVPPSTPPRLHAPTTRPRTSTRPRLHLLAPSPRRRVHAGAPRVRATSAPRSVAVRPARTRPLASVPLASQRHGGRSQVSRVAPRAALRAAAARRSLSPPLSSFFPRPPSPPRHIPPPSRPARPIAPVVEPAATLHHPAPPPLSIAVAPDHDRHGASSVDESSSSGVCMPNTGRSSAQRRHHPCTSTQMPCFRKEKGQLSQAASRKAECARAHAHASDTSHQPPTARLLRNTAPLAITPTPLALSTHFARGAGRASRNTTHHAGPFPPHLSI